LQKITPCLWFNGQAEEAAKFYTSVFKNSKIGRILRYGDAGPGPKGNVLMVAFELDGLEYTALNGGPQFKFTEAISLQIDCKSQEEVDYYSEKLSEGGSIVQCGWLKDKFGLSWQVVPSALIEMLNDADHVKADSAVQAMTKMKKIDIAEVQKAFAGS
jgi:predicted 3-demethylubiquinone-9 3-methyltransferase (glyoxalase superfamily)